MVVNEIIYRDAYLRTVDVAQIVPALHSRIQDMISSCKNCSGTENPLANRYPGYSCDPTDCLTSSEWMVLNSLANDLNNIMTCIGSEEIVCPFFDFFYDIQALTAAIFNWRYPYSDYTANFKLQASWDTYYSFASELYKIWEYREAHKYDNTLEQYALLSKSLKVVDFFKIALSPTDTEFKKMEAVS